MDHSQIEQALAESTQVGSRTLDRACARYAQWYIENNCEPQFAVTTADFDADPYLICVDRYWNLRITAEPTIHTAVNCAAWLNDHVAADVRPPIWEKLALGYAFVTRKDIETVEELDAATDSVVTGHDADHSRAYFAALYHAGKLKASGQWKELEQFLGFSKLAKAAGPHQNQPLYRALQVYAQFGIPGSCDDDTVGHFEKIWHRAGESRQTKDVLLAALADAPESQGELLRRWAADAVQDYPDDHMFRYRLATGQYLCGDYDGALGSSAKALRLLPAIGWRISHDLLLEQYLGQRQAILNARASALREQAHAERMSRLERELKEVVAETRRSNVHSMTSAGVFVAILAVMLTTVQIIATGTMSVSDRAWLIGVLDVSLLVYVPLLVVAVSFALRWWFGLRR